MPVGPGYRMFGEDAVQWLSLINAAKHLGLPLEEIGELLAVWEAGVCSDVKADLRPGSPPADRAPAVAALATAEQQCCPFFDFRLDLDGPVVHLEVRAPGDGAVLLAEMFGPPA